MIKIFTIGVYNSTEEEFYRKLADYQIGLFCDIRQRRGLRGSQYKFANSKYLQTKLADMGIRYEYIKELAPTKEIRNKQKIADEQCGITKKQRTTLGKVFEQEYKDQILSKYNLHLLISHFEDLQVQSVVFFCVEEKAEACHRSIVANQVGKLLNCSIVNL